MEAYTNDLTQEILSKIATKNFLAQFFLKKWGLNVKKLDSNLI